MEILNVRKLPVTVEAVMFDGSRISGTEITLWLHNHGATAIYYSEYDSGIFRTDNEILDQQPGEWAPYLAIGTLEGDFRADVGDFIIRGVRRPPLSADFYPCKPDVFAQTYEILSV